MNPRHARAVFAVLIGDVIRSRRLNQKERATVQAQLQKTLRRINRLHEENICARLQFTAGDEFQGVFKDAGRVFEVINRIREGIYPVPVRFGIGIGEITTPISDQPQAMDGPAFHRARDALRRAQEFLEQTCFFSGRPESDEAINAWLDILSFVRSMWSVRAREVIHLYQESQRLEPVARKLGISVQAVSKHLRSAGYKVYARGERVLAKLLTGYGRTQPTTVESERST